MLGSNSRREKHRSPQIDRRSRCSATEDPLRCVSVVLNPQLTLPGLDWFRVRGYAGPRPVSGDWTTNTGAAEMLMIDARPEPGRRPDGQTKNFWPPNPAKVEFYETLVDIAAFQQQILTAPTLSDAAHVFSSNRPTPQQRTPFAPHFGRAAVMPRCESALRSAMQYHSRTPHEAYGDRILLEAGSRPGRHPTLARCPGKGGEMLGVHR